MSMFKKPKRNFRSRRVADDGSDGENPGDEGVGEKNGSSRNGDLGIPGLSLVDNYSYGGDELKEVKKIKKVKKKKDKKDKDDEATLKGVVSFDHDEEEGEVFKIKKSSHSKRIVKQLKKESQKEKKDQEILAKPTEGEKQMPVQNEANGGEAEIVEGMDVDSDVSGGEEERKPSGFKDDSFRTLLECGIIPDAKTIHLVRKQRQKAREQGDFIPIDDPQKTEEDKSRLVREDDNDLSEDEERISFSVNTKEQEMRRRQDTFLAVEHGSDESDQENEWEEQQIKKGVSIPQVATKEEESNSAYYNYQQYVMEQAPTSSIFNPVPFPESGADSNKANLGTRSRMGPPKDLPQFSVDQIRKRLQDRVEELNSVHRAHVQEREDLDNRCECCENNIVKAEESVERLENQFRFFQEMRGYVRDLVECLNEKYPQITLMERQMTNVLKTRAEKLVKRRQEDIKDQSQDFVPGKNSSSQTELSDPAKQRRAAEREARRARRRRARENQSIRDHRDGLSSDDEESKSDMSKYRMDRERIMGDAASIFEDVVDDFYRVSSVKNKFERWKFQQRESYEEAYIGLCLPKLFTPLITLQLLNWNPLESSGGGLESSRWYESLMFYGYEEGSEPNRDDVDIKLMPSIIEKVLLPKITGFIENVWDPLSESQTKNLVKVITNCISGYPTLNAESRNTQILVKAVTQRIRKSLDDDVFIPLYPKDVMENKSHPASIFCNRQVWTSIKLLGNILTWHEVLGEKPLQELALDGLLNRYLMLALHTSGVSSESIYKCMMITSTFPKEWFSDLKSDSTIPQLENLCRYLIGAAAALEKDRETDRKELRENIKHITKMLVNIHAMDHALILSNQYSLKL